MHSQPSEDVNKLSYFGSTITCVGGRGENIVQGICKGRFAPARLYPDKRNNQDATTNIKMKIFNTNVKFVLLYHVKRGEPLFQALPIGRLYGHFPECSTAAVPALRAIITELPQSQPICTR